LLQGAKGKRVLGIYRRAGHRSRKRTHSVDEGSPAAQVGIQPQDVVLSINGRPSDSLTMKATREILKANAGAQIALQIKRGENALNLKLALKRVL